jgi:hypothetical protein
MQNLPKRGPDLISAMEAAKAIALRKDPRGYALALRQVQHWTDRRLLRPAGQLRTGTGVGRRYPATLTIPIAAILQELVLFGFTIEQLQPVARQLYASHRGQEGISLAAALSNRHSQLLLAFRVSRGKKHLTALRIYDGTTQGAQRELIQQKSRGSIVIDLAAVFRQIKWPAGI